MRLNYFNEDDGLVKSGLLFYDSEGEIHTDSKGNKWSVTKDQIQEIVDNTNSFLSTSDIPVFKEHNKTVDNQVGKISDILEAREIDDEDIELNPKLAPLKGKLGIFCDTIEIKDDDLINKISKGLGKGISIGIDFAKNIIRELSFVGIPALAGASVFKSNNNMVNFNTGLTLGEVVQSKNDLQENREEAHELLDAVFEAINNINSLSDGELQGQPRDVLYQNVLEEYMQMIPDTLPMALQDQYGAGGQYQQPDMAPQGYGQGAMTPTNQGQYGYYSDLSVFTMDGMDRAMRRRENAEFFLNINLPNQKRKKKEGSLLGKIGKGALALGAGAAALRYKGAVGAGLKKAAGKGIGGKLASVGKSVGKTMRFDARNPMRFLKGVRGGAVSTGKSIGSAVASGKDKVKQWWQKPAA